jgi:hypothetical protein
VISARTAQGYEEFKASTPQERLAITTRWKELEADNLRSSQDQPRTRSDSHGSHKDSPKRIFHSRHLSFEERKKEFEETKAKRQAERYKIQCQDGKPSCPFCRRVNPHAHTPRAIDPAPIPSKFQPNDENPEFEQAIQASIAATSRGNEAEDTMIERAIRASIRELQDGAGDAISDQDALNRAIQASISTTRRHPTEESGSADEDTVYQTILEKSIRDSLASYNLNRDTTVARQRINKLANKNLRLVPVSNNPKAVAVYSDEDEDLELAIRRSKEDYERSGVEEEIVMQYMKRQSLVEEAIRLKRLDYQEDHSQKLRGTDNQPEAGKESAADEEALQMAIEESLNVTPGGHTFGSDSES